MKKQALKRVLGVGKFAAGFIILVVVIYKYWEPDVASGSPGLRDLLQGPVVWKWLAVCLPLVVTAMSLQIVRWYILVRSLNIPFTLRRAFQLGLMGLFGNTFLPGGVGGDFFKAYFLASDSPGQRTAAASTVLMDRGLGLFGWMLVAALFGSLAWVNGDARIVTNVGLQWLVKLAAAIAGGGILGFLLLGFLPQRYVDGLADQLRVFPRFGAVLSNLWCAVWKFRQHLRAMGFAVLLSAAAQFLLVSAFHSAAQVFPPENPETDLATFTEHLVVVPVGYSAQILPLSPGGVGVGEAVFAGLYQLADRPQSRGVIAQLAMRIAEWTLAFAAWIVYFRMRGELRVASRGKE